MIGALWLCTAALIYACTLTTGLELAIVAFCTALVGGYAGWCTFYREDR